MNPSHPDQSMHAAAFSQARRLEQLFDDEIPWRAIEQGFVFQGEKVFLANRARGIFKPRQLGRGLLSIKTTEPRQGRVNIYSDQETDEGYFRYSLQRGDAYAGGNKHLWEALEDRTPFIYFHAVAEGLYKAIWPCCVTNIHAKTGFAEIVVGSPGVVSASAPESVVYTLPAAPERRYAVQETKRRLYQATFRENVLQAYNDRCAISGLPIRRLLDAAHITPDAEVDSSVEVSNGISLSRLHHQAFDANLLGITPDLKVVVSSQLLDSKDGALLTALQCCHNSKISVPRIEQARPDRDRLAMRFELFSEAQLTPTSPTADPP
ncbi:MAG: HNH endonuclease [Pseudomonadales bacterium]